MKAELIADVRNQTGESPVWSPEERALYWVDIPDRRLYRWDSHNGRIRSWQGPEMLACIARDVVSGGFVAGMETGFFHISPHAQTPDLDYRLLAEVPHAFSQMRLNDGRCDRQGRFWAGSMQCQMQSSIPAGRLYRYDSTGVSSAIVADLLVPNGLAFSPEGTRMYLSDSHPSSQQIWSFDYDIDEGRPYNQQLLIDMQGLPGRPDGAAIDEDGCYWICANDAGLIHRFTPQGQLDYSVAVPVSKPTMCAFGGERLDTLFVTSIRPGDRDLADQPLAGGVFAIPVAVKGLPEPAYSDGHIPTRRVLRL